MNNKMFWYDVLRAGAIVGIVMALSRIFERYQLVFRDADMGSIAVVYLLEWFVAAGLFIAMLYFFARRRAKAADAEVGFSYGQALSYILLVSMLAGVIVGVADTIYINAMGYDVYVDGLIGRLGELRNMYIGVGYNGADIKMFDDVAHSIRTSEQPSMLSNVFAGFNNYILFGGLPGLIIASLVRRDPEHRAFNE